MKLGQLIAIARECKGWTLRDLERECGVSNALISQIERGHVKDPGFSTVVRIAKALGLSVDRCASTVFHFKDALRQGATATAEQPAPAGDVGAVEKTAHSNDGEASGQ